MDTAIVVFTRDLRLHDNPALHLACARARQVVPVFVVDPAIAAPPNRARFLAESLADLRASLRERGGDLVIRDGDPAAEVIKLAGETKASAVYLADDVSRYASAPPQARARMRDAPARPDPHPRPDRGAARRAETGGRRPLPGLHPVLAGLARGDLAQALPGASASPAARPSRDTGRIPARADASPALAPGGETPAASSSSTGERASWPATARTTTTWTMTSRLSAYLRFGCVSPLEVAIGALDRPGGEEYCRQLAWRDFFYQVTAAFPDIARKNYRPGAAWHAGSQDRAGRVACGPDRDTDRGRRDAPAGRRGLHAQPGPDDHRLVPHPQPRHRLAARIRALRRPARGRRRGRNAGNWQWVAGTGNNTRPNRVMNPLRQARRFDHDGQYVRRYVPELAAPGPGRHPDAVETGPHPRSATPARSWSCPDRKPQVRSGLKIFVPNGPRVTPRSPCRDQEEGRHQHRADDVDGGVGGLHVAADHVRPR